MAMACGNSSVMKEKREADPERMVDGLVADLAVRGLWQLQSEALFNIHACC